MSDFSRQIEIPLQAHLQDNAEHKNVALLIGARQIGKSTTLAKLIKDKKHYSLI
jgi:flagellar biosynthesis GTPase FlhF